MSLSPRCSLEAVCGAVRIPLLEQCSRAFLETRMPCAPHYDGKADMDAASAAFYLDVAQMLEPHDIKWLCVKKELMRILSVEKKWMRDGPLSLVVVDTRVRCTCGGTIHVTGTVRPPLKNERKRAREMEERVMH